MFVVGFTLTWLVLGAIDDRREIKFLREDRISLIRDNALLNAELRSQQKPARARARYGLIEAQQQANIAAAEAAVKNQQAVRRRKKAADVAVAVAAAENANAAILS